MNEIQRWKLLQEIIENPKNYLYNGQKILKLAKCKKEKYMRWCSEECTKYRVVIHLTSEIRQGNKITQWCGVFARFTKK